MRITKRVLASIAALTLSFNASAALFDTIDSVETIQRVAAQQEKADRMPAGQESKPTADPQQAETSPAPEKTETKKK
jgi:hypothetical protein